VPLFYFFDLIWYNYINMEKHRGFTLIVLLVVIAVIAILAGLVIIRISNASASAKDVKRVADLDELAKALEMYKIKFDQYPDNTDSDSPSYGCWGNWDAGNDFMDSSDSFIQPLVSNNFISKTPRENTNIKDGWNSNCTYRYMRAIPGGCSDMYGVLFTALETDSTKFATSDERPSCVTWGEGNQGRDYAIYLKE